MKNLVLIALSTITLSAHAWEPDVYVGANAASMNMKNNATPGSMTFHMIEGVAGLQLIENLAIEARIGGSFNTARDQFNLTLQTDIPVMNDSGTPDDPSDDVQEMDAFGDPVFLAEDVTFSQEAEMNFYGSVYLKPMIGNERASLYGLLGYTTVELEHSVSFTSRAAGADSIYLFDDSEGDVSYGIGASFNLWENAVLTAEWRRLINANDFDIRGGSLGFLYTY